MDEENLVKSSIFEYYDSEVGDKICSEKEVQKVMQMVGGVSEYKKYSKSIKPDDSAYIKPFVRHSFSGCGKLLVLRVGGKIPGDSQRELSTLGNKNAIRAINETMVWFNPSGKQ